MQQKFALSFVMLAAFGLLSLAACGSGSSKLSGESLKTSPKDSIAYQFELVKAGNVDKLKECFTERQRDKITSEAVEKGKAQSSKYTLDDLVNSVETGESGGQKTAK